MTETGPEDATGAISHPATSVPRRRRGRKTAIVILGMLPLALLIGGLATAGGFLLARDDTPEIPSGVDQYRIIYDLETEDGSFVRQLEVDRPFLGRQTDRRGSMTGPVVAERYTALGLTGEREGEEDWIVLHAPAQAPVGDARFDQTMEDAIAAGLLVEVGTDEIAGRDCTITRSGGDPEGPYEVYEPDDRSYTERCIDDDGLLLARSDVVRDAPVLTLRATEVITEPSFPGERLDPPGEPLDVRQGGGAFEKVTADARLPGIPTWKLPEGAEGHNYVGRYVFIAPTYPERPADASKLPAYLTDVWLRGPQTFLLIQGPVDDDTRQARQPDGASEVDIGDAGDGTAVVGVALNEIRVDYRRVQARLLGAVPQAMLLDLARKLVREAPVTPSTSTTSTTSTTVATTTPTELPTTAPPGN